MKKLKKLLHPFSARHNLGLKIHLAREDVLEEWLKNNLLIRTIGQKGSNGASECLSVFRHILDQVLLP